MTSEILKPHPPIPVRASKANVHKFAESAADRLEYRAGGAIQEVIARLGGSIEYSDPFEDGPHESIVVRDRGDFTIWISSFTSPTRDRFTVAHELGHYFLHFPKVYEAHPGSTMTATRWVDEKNREQQRAEWEANWFAAGFLMPETEFREMCSMKSIEDVASHFGVSVSAAQIRKKSLEID